MMSMKELTLERKREPGGQLGSFGFSVLGGAGTKFPAVVCDLDQDGPAFQSEQVQCVCRVMQCLGMIAPSIHPLSTSSNFSPGSS